MDDRVLPVGILTPKNLDTESNQAFTSNFHFKGKSGG